MASPARRSTSIARRNRCRPASASRRCPTMTCRRGWSAGSLKTLLYMAQIASISMDPWFSTMDDLDHADQVAIDLDPQPGATFDQILDVARWVHDILERVNVRGYPKTSGSEGLHVFIPLPPGTPVRGRHAVLPDRRHDGCEPAPEGGHGAAHGRQAEGRHGVCGLSPEHPGQDARVRLQRPRQRVCRRVGAADLGRGRTTARRRRTSPWTR